MISGRQITQIVNAVFRSQRRRKSGEVNIVFVDRKKIRQLNQQFLNTKGDTDVIAFPYEDKGGDICICIPVARVNAKRYDEPFKREMLRLIIHGTLHLIGYSDYPKKERDKMWAQQEPLVKKLWEKIK